MEPLQQLPTILGALVLAAVLWVVKTTNDTQREVAVLRSLMEGSNKELDRLREGAHSIRNLIQGLESRFATLETRLDSAEQRLPDRRRHDDEP